MGFHHRRRQPSLRNRGHDEWHQPKKPLHNFEGMDVPKNLQHRVASRLTPQELGNFMWFYDHNKMRIIYKNSGNISKLDFFWCETSENVQPIWSIWGGPQSPHIFSRTATQTHSLWQMLQRCRRYKFGVWYVGPTIDASERQLTSE